MVKKLIKWDFASYLRLLLPVQLILLGIAALNRFIQLFEDSSSSAYEIVFGSSVFLYVVSVIVAIVLTFVVSIVRFYQGMYTNEGYLTHTLPVTPAQHIFSKLIVTMLFYLGTFFAIFLSFIILTLGELNIEIFKAFGYMFGKLTEYSRGHFIMYFIELILLILGSLITSTLSIYFCISIGQLAQKRKILLAFGAYFGLYFIKQVLGTIIIIIFTLLGRSVWDVIGQWVSYNIFAFYHFVLIGALVVELVMAVIYFLLTRFIMKKKLNLT